MKGNSYSFFVARCFAFILFLCAADLAFADDCPVDKFALWTGKHLHGANIFQGRNPKGGSNGIGDGNFAQSDFDELRQAGANYVHLSHAGVFEEAVPYALDSVAEAALDLSIQRAMTAGLYVVIAFRSGPGRNENAITNRDGLLVEEIWTKAAARTAWVRMLKRTAERYNGNPAVVGYSVMVEPNSYARHGFIAPDDFYGKYAGTLQDVNGLFALATTAIREVDSNTPILLEPEGYGNIKWLPYVSVTGDSRTVYTAHDYTPFEYTHRQVKGATYPGYFDLYSDGQQHLVDKAFLTDLLGTVSQFGQSSSVPVAITEFGVHRTASDPATYLNDRIDIQNAIGSWAVWAWQPTGFDDPFSVHDSSSVHDALAAAWSYNCTPVFEKPEQFSGMLKGRSFTYDRVPIKGVKIRAGANTVTSGLRGRYAITLPVGSYELRAVSKGASCLIRTPRGPKKRSVEIEKDIETSINVYCKR